MYYIYAYIDPRTSLPFYIGKGKKERKFDHLNEKSSKHENKNKWKIISELRSLGLDPVITELESNIENENLAYNREDFYILSYGRQGIDPNGILTNKTINNRPPTPVWTEERKQKHSVWNKKYWTEERRAMHNLSGSVKTVSVTDLFGNSKRIPKEIYDNINRSGTVDTWEYVSVSSNESTRRKSLRTVT